jgi:hypothetical protein
MKKTLTCICGGEMAYKTDKESDIEFIDGVFYAAHTDEGHEVTEQPDVYVFDEE